MPATTNPNSKPAGKISSSSSSDRIADYFCIVGAGDSLQLKHGGGHNSTTHTHTTTTTTTNEEDRVHQECALVERFYREIVDVKLLSGKEDELEAAKLEGYVILRYVHNLNPNKNNHPYAQNNHHHRAISHSENSSNQEHQQHLIRANLNPHDSHKSNSKFLNQVMNENVSSNDHENKRSPGRITLAAATACYHNYEEYASIRKTSKVPSSTSSPDPSTSTSPNKFNSLLGKGQSKLLSKFSNQNYKEQPEQLELMQEEEYYLAFRRRVPDDSHLPAISDVRIFYICLPKQELQFNNNNNRKSSALDKSRSENKSHKQKWNDALSKGGALWQKAAGTAQNILKHPHMQDAHSLNRSSSNISHIQNRTFMNTPSSTKLARSFDLHGDSDEDDHSRQHLNCQSDNQSVGWRSLSGMSVQSNTPSVDAVGNRVSIMELLKVPNGYSHLVLPTVHRRTKVPIHNASTKITSPPKWHTQEGIETSYITPPSSRSNNSITNIKIHAEPPSVEYCQKHCVTAIPILATRQQHTTDRERFYEDVGLIDLCIILKEPQQHQHQHLDDYDDDSDNEEALLQKSCWKTQDISFTKLSLRLRHNAPIGFCDVSLNSRVLDRCPKVDYEGLSMPEEELPLFAPSRLLLTNLTEMPLPQSYGFVLKNIERGDTLYVSCLEFVEVCCKDKLAQLEELSRARMRTSIPSAMFVQKMEMDRRYDGPDSSLELTGFDESVLCETKIICLVSRHAFWNSFDVFLNHVYRISQGTIQSDVDIEQIVRHFALQTPAPTNETVLFSSGATQLTFNRPHDKDLPLFDLSLRPLFACMDIPTIVVSTLGFLLLERKILLISKNPTLILNCCEALCSLLFPFELCAPYVPRLTLPFQSTLEFPGAALIGIHDDGGELATRVRADVPLESILLDLDECEVYTSDESNRFETVRQCWNLLPAAPTSTLVQELTALCRDVDLLPGQDYTSNTHTSTSITLDDRAVRDAFLRFFTFILQNYESYLLIPDANFLVSSQEWFDADAFVASASNDCAAYLASLVNTQSFHSLIQKRMEASDLKCLLFDECMREYCANKLAYGRLGGDCVQVQDRFAYSLLVDQCACFHEPNQRIITVPTKIESTNHDMTSTPISYFVDGHPCFPTTFHHHDYNFPEDKSSTPNTTTSNLPTFTSTSFLTRTFSEHNESILRIRSSTRTKGLHSKRRCLWQFPKLLAAEVLGSWLLCVPSYISFPLLSSTLQERMLLRALGAIRLLRNRHRVLPDEASYRAIMIACGRAPSDRRQEVIKAFGMLRGDGDGVHTFPSAVTLGQYTKAVAAGFSKRGVEVQLEDSNCLRQQLLQQEPVCALDTNLLLLEEAGKGWRRRSGHNANLQTFPWCPILQSSSFVEYKYCSEYKLLALWSKASACVHCSYVPLDEELMAGWDELYSSGNSNNNNISDDSFYSNGKGMGCPRCGATGLMPRLAYRMLSVKEALSITETNVDERDGAKEEGRALGLPPQTRHCRNTSDGFLEIAENDNNPDTRYDRDSNFDNDFDFKSSLNYNLDLQDIDHDFDDSKDTKTGTVPYLDPCTLRRKLESYVSQHGEEGLTREYLMDRNYSLLINLWWYAARFSLPLPLPIGNSTDTYHCVAFASYDERMSLQGCLSAAECLCDLKASPSSPTVPPTSSTTTTTPISSWMGPSWLEKYDKGTTYLGDTPLLSNFNLQQYCALDWENEYLSKALVRLVEACDKLDFAPAMDALVQANCKMLHCVVAPTNENYNHSHSTVNHSTNNHGDNINGTSIGSMTSDLTSSNKITTSSGNRRGRQSMVCNKNELDVYRTLIYLSRYQCTSAFHRFFPTTSKPCRGFHFWCGSGSNPHTTFDSLFHKAATKLLTVTSSDTGNGANDNIKQNAPGNVNISDGVSDTAICFRCVFGHII